MGATNLDETMPAPSSLTATMGKEPASLEPLAEDNAPSVEDNAPTQPASPVGSGKDLQDPGAGADVPLEFTWQPKSGQVFEHRGPSATENEHKQQDQMFLGSGLQGPQSASSQAAYPAQASMRGIGSTVSAAEEALGMSSDSYFRTSQQERLVQQQQQEQLLEAEKLRQEHRVKLAQQQPFPKARDAVRQRRLEEVSGEVRSLALTVSSFAGSSEARTAHPAELQRVLELADGIQARSKLREEDLESAGWPQTALRKIRDIVHVLTRWQQSEDAAKQVISNKTGAAEKALTDVVAVLEEICSNWRDLKACAEATTGSTEERLRVDLGLGRRASAATPMVSAMLDKALALTRREPDLLAVRRLEALLAWQADQGVRSAAWDLGVSSLLEPAMRELSECMQGLSPTTLEGSSASSAPARGSGALLSAPEILWRAIVNGDVYAVESIIRQGGLVSGRTQDPSGHSVLWNAIAFQRTEVALLLLRYFPPDALHGVSLGELHQRNGNSLLHLISSFQPFPPQAEGLFAVLFERMPEAMRVHRNLRGQSFVHIAAGRLNFPVLRFAASSGLISLFSVADGSGWTPRTLLEQHLVGLKINVPNSTSRGHTAMPAWCAFGALQPPGLDKPPPFSDAVVQVSDKEKGKVSLHTHRVILAASSRVWHDMMRRRSSIVTKEAQVLAIDPGTCNDAEVANFALRYLYTSEADGCNFRDDAFKLLQLFKLCKQCSLPAPLLAWATHALLTRLEEGRQSSLVPQLLLEASTLGLSKDARRLLARQLVCNDAAWQAAADAKMKTEQARDVDGGSSLSADAAAGTALPENRARESAALEAALVELASCFPH